MANRPPARASSFSSQLWIWMLAFSTALLLLLGWSFLHLEPGTPSYVIGQVGAIVLSLTILGTLVALLSDWEPF